MTDLRTAAQQALEALYEETAWFGPTPKGAAAIAALRAALAQQAESPCACWPSQMCSRQAQEPDDIKKQLANALDSAEFYRRRCEALQSWQSKMRDPERIIVCDILANGKTLDPAFAGDRYTAPPQKAEPAQEPVAWIDALKDAFFEGFTSVATYNDTLLNSPEEAWENYKPPRAAPPQRKPLTEEEILKAIGWERAEMYMKLTPNFPIEEARKETIKNARAIERAHGIKE